MERISKRLTITIVITVTVLLLFLTAVTADSFTLTRSDGQSLMIQVAQENEEELIEIEDDPVPLGLPQQPACHTHFVLLGIAVALGVAYTIMLVRTRNEVVQLERRLREVNHE